MYVRHTSLLFFLLFLKIVSAQQNAPCYSFVNLNVEDGLSQTVVNCIEQDKQGFMWFGTTNGLNRYDGSHFKVYKNDRDDSLSVCDNNIKCLHADKAGFLWVGTAGGLHKYIPEQDNFKVFRRDPSNAGSISHDMIYAMDEDKQGNLFVGTLGGGLNLLDIATEQFSRINYRENRGDEDYTNDVRSVLYTANGLLYIGYEAGIVDILDSNYRLIKTIDGKMWNNVSVMDLFEDSKAGIWIGTYGEGVFRYDPADENITAFTTENSELSNNIIWNIFEAKNQELWLSTRGGGINIYNLNSGEFDHISSSPDRLHCLSSNKILNIFEDNSGICWIATEDIGINILNREIQRFHTVIPKLLHRHVTSNDVNAVCKDSKGNLWMAVQESGVLVQYAGEKDFVNFNTAKGNLGNDNVLSILEDDEYNIWFGTEGNGIDVYDPDEKTFIHYKPDENTQGALKNGAVHALEKDHAGNIWVGTYGGGLNKFDKETKTFTNYPVDDDGMENIVLDIYEDNKYNIWIGTYNKGLGLLGNSGEFRFYSNRYNDPESLSNNTVFNICQTNNEEYLWLGTGGGGLVLFDMKRNDFVDFTENDGLSNDVVNNVIADNDGKLWIGTINGLNRFTPLSMNFRRFDRDDGLQGNKFLPNASFKDKDGILYFGGKNGLSIFNPDEILSSEYTPPIVFTDLRIANESIAINDTINGQVVLKSSISTADEISLSYDHNLIVIEFAALDYRNPKKIEYQYFLEGFDRQWNATGANVKYIAYTHLPSGEYLLKIRSTNSDGAWCENIKTLKIFVAPPFWETKWFIAIMLVLFLCIIYLIIKYKTIALRRNNQILETKVAERTTELEEHRDEILKQTGQILIQREKILDQKELLESKNRELERLSIAAQEADSEIVIINKSGFVEWVNERFARQFNVPKKTDFKKKPYNYVLQSKNNILYKEFKRCLATKHSVNFEMQYKDKYNRTVYAQTSLTPIFNVNGEVDRLVSVSNDITQQKIAEQQIIKQKDQITKQHDELQEYRKNLERLVEERTEELKTALRRAKESDRLKISFLTNISHEIRTPMNSIVGFTDLLLHVDDDTKKEHYRHMINENAETLIRVIDDIIDLSQIETGQVEFKKQSFSPDNRLSLMKTLVEKDIDQSKKDIKLIYKVAEELKGIRIYSDAFRIDQVMINLLKNSVKYTEKGTIEYGYETVEKDGKAFLQFYCKDTGIGMKSEEIEGIFKSFTKIEENKRKIYRGVGLGLAISKNVVELLGGKITVESEVGKGSVFFFTIPYIVQEKVKEAALSFENKLILVAEDEDANYALIEALLRLIKAKVVRAKSGAEAVSLHKELSPDAVLMDIKMPEMDGYEATAAIRKTDSDTPIIAQTAYALMSDKKKMIDSGFTDILLKPLNKNLVFQLLKKYLTD